MRGVVLDVNRNRFGGEVVMSWGGGKQNIDPIRETKDQTQKK